MALDKTLPFSPVFLVGRCRRGLWAYPVWSCWNPRSQQVCLAAVRPSTSGRHGADFRASASAPGRKPVCASVWADALGAHTEQDYESHWHNSIPSALLNVFPGPLVLSHAHSGSLQFCYHSLLPSKQELILCGKCWFSQCMALFLNGAVNLFCMVKEAFSFFGLLDWFSQAKS